MRNLLLLALAIFIAGCSGSKLEPLDSPVELKSFTPRLEVKRVWAGQMGGGVGREFLKLPPLLEGERIYAANYLGEVAAFDSQTGKRLWNVELQSKVSAGVGNGGDLLLLGADDEVIALSKEDGSVVWRSTVSSEVLVEPVHAGDIIIVRSVDGTVEALNADSGDRLWSFAETVPTLSLRGLSRPIVYGDGVLVGFASGRMAALRLSDGQMYWQSNVGVPRGRTELERLIDVDAHFEVADGVIYAASYQGKVAALVAASGEVMWSRDISSYSGVALDTRYVYVSDERGDLWALSRANGAALWKQDVVHGRRLSAPVTQGRFIVVGDYEGYLHWFDREDGHLAGRVHIGDSGASFNQAEGQSYHSYSEERGVQVAPLVDADMVYAYDKRGTLAAFRVSVISAEVQ